MSDIAKMIAIAKRFGGGGSGGGEVVILPEAEIAVASGESPITTAPSAVPEVGAVCKVTYNGTAYDCPAVAIPYGLDMTGVLLGNSDVMGVTGGNASAPFVVFLFDTPVDLGEGNSAYGMFVPVEEIAEGTSITLSIVQVAAASGSESAGGVLTVNCKISTSFVDNTTVFSDADKTWAEVKAAHAAGKIVRFVAKDNAIPASDYIGNVQGVIRVNNNEVMSVMFPKSLLYGSETLCSASANDDGSLKIAPSIAD